VTVISYFGRGEAADASQMPIDADANTGIAANIINRPIFVMENRFRDGKSACISLIFSSSVISFLERL
jgi:hypothetical protein